MNPRRMYFRRGPVNCPLAVYHTKNGLETKVFSTNHWHPQFEIIYVQRGQLLLKRLTSELLLQQGHICLLPPDEIHQVHHVAANSEIYHINFSPELITLPEGHFFHEQFLSPLRSGKLQFPEVITADHSSYEEVHFHVTQIIGAEKADPNYNSKVFFHALGFCLALLPFCAVTEDQHLPTGSKGNDTIKLCHQYIGRHYMETITLDQLAALVHLHPNYLCRLFKKYTGQTVVENINTIRVSFATQFIRNTDQTLPQIAEACGFNSMTYFTKIFKQHTGSTPYAYSKLYKNL